MDHLDVRRIVVGVDASEHSRRALRWTAYLGARHGAVIDAVYVWEAPLRGPMTPGLANLDWNPAVTAEKVLCEAVDEVFGPHRPMGMRLVTVEGYPPKVLVERSEGAHLLVVGSRGRTGLTARLLGSVSANVAEHASCPVLVVHNTEPPTEEQS